MNKKPLLIAASLFLFLAVSARAATFTVTKLADTNDGVCDADCSLREAVAAANTDGADSTVHFAPALYFQTLTVNSEIVTSSADKLTIETPGSGYIWLAAAGATNRLFYVNNPAFTLNGFTMFYGAAGGTNPGYGGVIASFGGADITIDRIQFFSNTASIEGGLGYFVGGTLNISNSNLQYSNSPKCGALSLTGTAATIKNSAVRGNGSLSANVGGICLKSGSSLSMTNDTITANGSAGGSAIYIENSTLVLGNTVIAGSNSNNGNYPEIWFASGTVTSLGYNHIGDAPGDAANTGLPIAWTGTDTLDIPPMLSGDDPHGGGMTTTIPLTGSPLINTGSNALAAAAGLTTDQRGFSRVVGGSVDKGANEFGASALPPTAASVSIAGRVTDANGRGIAGVVITMSGQEGTTRTALTNPFGYYRFDDVAGGASYTVSASAKRYRFESRVFTAGDDLLDLNFIAQ